MSGFDTGVDTLVDEVLAVRHDDRTYTKEFEQLTQMCYAHDLPTVR